MFGESGARRCRADFPSLARRHDDKGLPLAFLDGPAGTQVPSAVIEAIAGYYRTCNANTHGQFVTSRESDALIAATRETVATFLGAPSGRTISLGQNMTTLCYSLSHALGHELSAGDEVVITQLDHEANRGPWIALRERGVNVKEVRLRPDGRLDYDDMAAKIGARTRVVALGLSSNALGTVNDAALARTLSRAVGALLVLDAVHYAPHFPVDVAALDPDYLLCSAYKFYGPHVGILYARPGLLEKLEPDRLRTQEQSAPERFETGTLNHAALAGVKAAIDYIAAWGDGATLRERIVSAVSSIAEHEHGLARRYDEKVRHIPGVRRWGVGFEEGPRAPTVSITIEGVTAEGAARRLGNQGVLVWDGNFYALRPIEVLGLADRGGVLRAGFSMYNTSDEVDRLLTGVAEIARRSA
ncbi:MAG: cysteine desulfurase-like protein [Acidobacteria bacterium]|nr:MAG: cysteine desulfurase-like protein [Acidobacteriota bacterium]